LFTSSSFSTNQPTNPKNLKTTNTTNREFQYYTNNRTNSFVEDGVLYLQPTLTENTIGLENVRVCPCVLREDGMGWDVVGWSGEGIDSTQSI
jgi:hypothetical protein